jgi:transcriptional regulator with XRE-family HTH domain
MIRLKLWRLQAGFTQREAAVKLGLGESTYGFLESGRMRPSAAQLDLLKRYFGDPEPLFQPVRDRVETVS